MSKFRAFLALTVLGGVMFLGCQAYEWHHLIALEGLSIKLNLFDATFFILTGFHGMHVTGGVIYLSTLLFHSMARGYTAADAKLRQRAGFCCHFVDPASTLIFTLASPTQPTP